MLHLTSRSVLTPGIAVLRGTVPNEGTRGELVQSAQQLWGEVGVRDELRTEERSATRVARHPR